MQKAIFFEEAYNKGILAKIDAGYILSVLCPDINNIDTKNDPFLIEMVSYSGVKAVLPIEGGVKFQAQGSKIFCMLEPPSYTEKYVEPTFRKSNSTGYMPFRFSDIESFLTKDNKFNVLLPKIPFDCHDSFTINFPAKGDVSILYLIFDKNINGVVLPFIEDNFKNLLKKMLGLRDIDAKNISRKFFENIKKFDVWPDLE